MGPFLEIAFGSGVAIIVPVLTTVLLRWLKMSENEALRQRLETAMTSAAGLAYMQAAKGSDLPVAVQDGASYVSNRMPETLDKLGLASSDLNDMIHARMGALFASDPTVKGPTL